VLTREERAAWAWAPITAQEDATGRRDPSAEEIEFDERWVALVLLAKQDNTGTRAGYRRDINQFMNWWQHERDPQLSAADRPLEASRTDIELFTAWLAQREPPLAAATRARKLAVVSNFYSLAETQQVILRTPLIGVRRPKVNNEDAHLGLPAAEADALLETAEAWSEEHEGTLTALLLLCGFRISEALAIAPVDITPRESGVAVAIKRKGHDAKSVFPIDDDWLSTRLLKLRAETNKGAQVFGDVDRFAALRIVGKLGRAAGIDPPPHPHILRHTFCAQLLRSGMDVRTVQKLAGHSSIEITQRYLDAISREQLAVSRRLRNVFKGVPTESLRSSLSRARRTRLT
jgi:integrase/recombinase XerD